MKKLGSGALSTHNGLMGSFKYDYIYCYQTYSGVILSSLDRLIDNKDKYLDRSKIEIKKFKPKQEPYIILEKQQDRYPGVLKSRCCIAGIIGQPIKDGGNAILHVIWFDDGDIPIEESLINILPEMDWENNAKDFEY